MNIEPGKARLITCQTCKATVVYSSDGYELSNCNHGFCRTCIKSAMEQPLLNLIQVNGMDEFLMHFDHNMQCPINGCKTPFSRNDLRLVLGTDMQSLIDECITTCLAYQILYPLARCCPFCKNKNQELLVPTSQSHSLRSSTIRKAFRCNNISLPPGNSLSKAQLVKHLKNIVPSFLLCSRCSSLICLDCGSKPAVVPEKASHQCDPHRRQWFSISRCIMKLWSAYTQESALFNEERKKKPQHTDYEDSSSTCSEDWQQDGVQDPALSLYGHLVKRFSGTYLQYISQDSQTEGVHVSTKGRLRGRKTSKRAVSDQMSSSDLLAKSSIHELDDCISKIVNGHMGAISPIISAMICSHDLLYTSLKWIVKNDSIIGIASKSDLLQTLLLFLLTLSECADFLPLLCSRESKHDCFAIQRRWETPGSIMLDLQTLDTQADFIIRKGVHLLYDDQKEVKHKRIRLEVGVKNQISARLPDIVSEVRKAYETLHQKISLWEGKTLQHDWLSVTASLSGSAVKHVNSRKADVQRQFLHKKIKAFIKDIRMRSSGSAIRTRAAMRLTQMKVAKNLSELELHSHFDESDDVKSKEKLTLKIPPSELVETYQRALRPLQFEEANLLSTFHYRKELKDTRKVMWDKSRTRAISHEMTVLNTSLPLDWESSIFLRIDITRADAIRALIVGPENTPYENGIFLFDILLGDSYPIQPPKVHFLTTGGGKVTFNPNLYACGHVCLSLLGTWSGPGWQPGKSNIMQVLLSIQGLILVGDPFYNEPGSHSWPGAEREANKYKYTQRFNTVQYSIIPALESCDPLFESVVHTHFQFKASYILSQCHAWMEEEPDKSRKKQFSTFIDRISHGLDKIRGTV